MFFIVFWWRFHWKIALTLRLWDGFCWFLCLNARARSKIAIVEIIPGYPVVETAIHSKKRCHFDLCILCFLAVAPNDNPNDTRTIAAQVMLCAMLEKEPWGVGEDLPHKCRWPFCSDGFEFWVLSHRLLICFSSVVSADQTPQACEKKQQPQSIPLVCKVAQQFSGLKVGLAATKDTKRACQMTSCLLHWVSPWASSKRLAGMDFWPDFGSSPLWNLDLLAAW